MGDCQLEGIVPALKKTKAVRDAIFALLLEIEADDPQNCGGVMVTRTSTRLDEVPRAEARGYLPEPPWGSRPCLPIGLGSRNFEFDALSI